MTNIVLPPVTNGNNISTLNDNFRKVQESVNNDLLNLDGGNNVMQQDLDMNGNQLLNIGVDVNNPQSLLTVGAGDSRYYNVSGDTLTGPMSVNGQVISGLAAAIASTSPVRKQEFDGFVSTQFARDAGQDATITANYNYLKSYIENLVAGVVGGSGFFLQDGAGAVGRTFQDKMRETFSVTDFGAVGSPALLSSVYGSLAAAQVDYPFATTLADTIDWAAFKAASIEALSQGGKKITIPAGTWYAYEIPLDTKLYWEGAGVDSTTVTQPNGNNKDIFVTRGFSAFTGVGPVRNAPVGFGVRGMTVDGNYLENWEGASIGVDTVINNTNGYGIRIFGSKYNIDCDIVNCAKTGFYSEAVDYTGYSEEQNSYVRISGRVFGKEAVVYRGPADCNLEHIIMGCPGWLPTVAARASTLGVSELFPSEPIHVMVSDEQDVTPGGLTYNGHHEFGFMHLYGNLNGLGYKTMDTGRLKGNHMVVENCRGGAYFGSRVWGNVSILEAHANGREPSTLAGTLPVFPDIEIASLQGFTIDATVRRNQSQAASYCALKMTGRLTNAKLNYYSIGTIPALSTVANITGSSNTVDIVCQGMVGDAVIVEGLVNDIRVNGRVLTGGSLVRRIAGATSTNRGNKFSIVATNCANVFNSDGLVTNEVIDISADISTGQTVTSGTPFDFVVRSPVVNVSGRIGANAVGSRRRGSINLNNTLTTEQTITVAHGYFQLPHITQVGYDLYDPSPSYGGVMQYFYVQSVDASNITFVYKLSSTGAGGPLVLLWRVES